MPSSPKRHWARANVSAISWSVLVLLFLLCSTLAPCLATARQLTVQSGIFGPREPLALRLEAPWRDLTRRQESGKSLNGRLIHTSTTGEELTLNVRFTNRGKSRLEVCDRPMLTLRLEKQQVAGTLFEGNPVLHLTAQCRLEPDYLQYLILEYLAFQTFALVTDHALETRLLSVEYVDPTSGRRRRQAYAFLVEDFDLAAARMGLEWQKPKSVELSMLEAEARALFVLFQYLIGNTDWSLRVGPRGEPCCHNVAMLGLPDEASGMVPIPFDLDSAGLVDAEYIVPDERLGIRSVRQRVYRGHCDLNAHLPGAIEIFNLARGQIEALFESSDQLSQRSRKHSRKYLASFFETVNSPDELAAEILDRCR